MAPLNSVLLRLMELPVVGGMLASLITASLSAQVVSYRVDLSLDSISHQPQTFGVSAPYSFSLTFTFDLGANPQFISVPQDTLTVGATGNWYLFAPESVTAISGNFGTRSFSLEDMQPIVLPRMPTEESEGFQTLFRADTDLTTTPSVVAFNLDFADGSSFNVGTFDADGHNEDYFLYDPTWSSADLGNDSSASGHISSIQSLSAVPEPSTYAAMAGACVLAFAAWRRRRANVARG